MKATVTWQGGMKFSATAGSGGTVLMDVTRTPEGTIPGPSPMEMVLMGLGGCTGIDVTMLLQKMREDLTGLEVDIEAERADEDPRVFTKVDMVYRLRGKSLSEEKVKRAIELTQTKYCSVLHMVNKTAKVSYRYEITED